MMRKVYAMYVLLTLLFAASMLIYFTQTNAALAAWLRPSSATTASTAPPVTPDEAADMALPSAATLPPAQEDEPDDVAALSMEGAEQSPWPYPPPPILVNAEHPLDENWTPEELVTIQGTYLKATPETASALSDMLDFARAGGVNQWVIVSAFRTYSAQEKLHERKTTRLESQMESEADAEAQAAREVARAGVSEHQLGLSIDISNDGSLEASFGDTPEGQWLAENAYLFGFVIRYPASKSQYTGIVYEPWHLRYVGTDVAQVLHTNDWCLEEYWSQYQDWGMGSASG